LTDCYDDAYSRELREAGMVVVPLWVADISAGQMVAIQAMAYHKPIIVTRTPTIEEYLHHESEALLVPPGDAEALTAAIERLRRDPDLARRLADTAYGAYVERHSMRAFVRNIVHAVEDLSIRPRC
jgi:glycosyltransferase involved in cell wall biosynthesis